MKKLTTTIAAFSFTLLSMAQADAGIKPSEPFNVTGLGTPDGQLVSKEIGTTGGTIVSDDGRVELIFPAGALTVKTAISIQPVTNPAPNGVGKSYWFEPSGIQFQKPVRIIFHYTDKENGVCPPEWMVLGIQDKSGKWSFVDYEEFDSTAKTLKGFIRHFSGASNINDIELRPDKYIIPVNGKTLIDVVDITQHDASQYAGPSGYAAAYIERNNSLIWYVNRVVGGNNLTGTATSLTAPLGKQKITVGTYTAPAIMPKENDVTIWVEVYRRNRKGKELRKRLTTYIQVYDAYEVSIKHKYIGRVSMNSEISDKGSFVVYVYPNKFIVQDIKNYEPTVIKEGRKGPFKEKVRVDGAFGTVHITEGIKNDSLSSDYPPEVYFEFSSISVLMCRIQHEARGIAGDVTPLFWKSIPEEINFIANGREQTYNVTLGNREGETYQLIVKPYRQ